MLRKIKHHNKQQGWFLLLIVASFILIMLWRESTIYQRPKILPLPDVPSESAMNLLVASDQAFVYRVFILWLQQFDVQAGQYISYQSMDYEKLIHWLQTLNKLELTSQYPLLLATRVYSRVEDQNKTRMMLEYVYNEFQKNPQKNWRWLAEAAITAQHKLKDLSLALKFATALAEEESPDIPLWAKDIRLIILENLGEFEQIKLLVGGLIVNKAVTDPNEIRFLSLLMKRVEEKERLNAK